MLQGLREFRGPSMVFYEVLKGISGDFRSVTRGLQQIFRDIPRVFRSLSGFQGHSIGFWGVQSRYRRVPGCIRRSIQGILKKFLSGIRLRLCTVIVWLHRLNGWSNGGRS